jgi:hypothetical protein
VTGGNAAALARLTTQGYQQAAKSAGVHHGDPIRSTDGWIAGYRPATTTHDATTIQVLIAEDGENLGFTAYDVHLTWRNGDWRLIAPTWGDWRTAAHRVANPYPPTYRSYDNLRVEDAGAS